VAELGGYVSLFHYRWEVNKKDNESHPITINPVKVVQVGKVPLTRLSSSEDGNYLAVGGSDGRVTLLHADTLKTVCLLLEFTV
jgi:WD40 repeat protein